MDRRQFLVAAARGGLALGALGLADVLTRSSPSAPSARPGDASPAPLVPSPAPSGAPRILTPAVRDNAVLAENRRRGDAGWDPRRITGPSPASAFVAPASIAAGEALTLHWSSRTAVDVDWFRLGWYGGVGGRRVRVDHGLPAAPPAPAAVDPVTGRVEAVGGSTLTVPIDPAWPSGVYLAVVRPAAGAASVAPFTIRPAPGRPPAPVLFVTATTTWPASNPWGGADLYDASFADTPEEASGRRAVQVSADRPFFAAHGAGLMPRWELGFVRWQERLGRDVDYAADVDLELHPDVVTGRRLVVFVGHHEYWSRPMRTTIEGAIAAGTNVAFLSADDMAWQVRLEPSPLGPARRITCYKSARLDPVTASDPGLATCRWRQPPVDDPEALVIGQQYGHIVREPGDWVVAGSGHWLYERTGLRDGDRIRNLVGQEYDTLVPSLAPPGTTLLARSPMVPVLRSDAAPRQASGPQPLDPALHTATVYQADSGAIVFAAGTFQWSWALDEYGNRTYRGVTTPLDDRVARMTRNLFDRLGDGPRSA